MLDLTNILYIKFQFLSLTEVRDHGTGYYAFSTDESKRKEQMEELKRMRQQVITFFYCHSILIQEIFPIFKEQNFDSLCLLVKLLQNLFF